MELTSSILSQARKQDEKRFGKRRKSGHLRTCRLNITPMLSSCACFVTEEGQQWLREHPAKSLISDRFMAEAERRRRTKK